MSRCCCCVCIYVFMYVYMCTYVCMRACERTIHKHIYNLTSHYYSCIYTSNQTNYIRKSTCFPILQLDEVLTTGSFLAGSLLMGFTAPVTGSSSLSWIHDDSHSMASISLWQPNDCPKSRHWVCLFWRWCNDFRWFWFQMSIPGEVERSRFHENQLNNTWVICYTQLTTTTNVESIHPKC